MLWNGLGQWGEMPIRLKIPLWKLSLVKYSYIISIYCRFNPLGNIHYRILQLQIYAGCLVKNKMIIINCCCYYCVKFLLHIIVICRQHNSLIEYNTKLMEAFQLYNSLMSELPSYGYVATSNPAMSQPQQSLPPPSNVNISSERLLFTM